MFGGERGIRTLDGLLTHTPLAGERLQPLGHLSRDDDSCNNRLPCLGALSDALHRVFLARHVQQNGPTTKPDSRRHESGSVARSRLTFQLLRLRVLSRGVSLGTGPGPVGLCLLALDALVDFLAMHGDVARGVDADTHLVALDAKDGNGDFVTNHEGLAHATSQDQHGFFLPFFP